MRPAVLEQIDNFNWWAEKVRFLAWCDKVLSRDDYDSYIPDIEEQSRLLGVTEADRQEYREMKRRALEPLPF